MDESAADDIGAALDHATKMEIDEIERYRFFAFNKLALDAQKSAPKKSSWMAFVEGPLGSFLLSSVVLPLCVWGYSMQRINVEKARAAEKLALDEKNYVEKLDFEISYRYSKAMSRLRVLDAKKAEVLPAEIAASLQPLTASANIASNPPLYLEFNSLSGYALMAELRRHLLEWQFSDTPPSTVGYAMANLSGLEETIDDHPRSAKEVAAALAGIMNAPSLPSKPPSNSDRPRWAKGFPRTRCQAENPFC